MSERAPLSDAELIRQMAAYIAGMETPAADEADCECCAQLQIELDSARAEMREAQTAHNIGAKRAAEEIARLRASRVELIKRLMRAGVTVSAKERLEAAGVKDEEEGLR